LADKQPDSSMIRRRRHVFHIAGYDPVSAQQQHRRFGRQLAIFKQTWDIQAAASELGQTNSNPSWSATAAGPNWEAEAVVELLAWDDLVIKDAAGSRIVRLLRALVAYANLLRTGTLFRYAAANQRYFLFAIVPLVEAILLGIVAWSVAWFLAGRAGLSPHVEYFVAAIGGLGVFLLLLEWPGRRWRIYQAFDDWILSLDYIYGKRPDLDARLDAFAARIASEAARGTADEVIVLGHSLGAIFAVDAVARAYAKNAELGRKGSSLSIVTVGATIPKCALHPAAQRLRDQIKAVVNEPSIFWVEYQSRADPISFYRFHPATLRRISGKEDNLDSKPLIRRVQIKDMLQPKTFAKYRLRVLRLHYQFVMANERRAPYDFFMMICGPVLLKRWTAAPLGLLDFFRDPRSAAVSGEAETSS
jgi:hypothetical protein